jgi:hypothetical protein
MPPHLTARASRLATALAALWAGTHAAERGGELQMAVELQMFSRLTTPPPAER